MSELKATTIYDAYWKANSIGEGTGILVYLKSEADKVIAELKAQKAQAEDDCAYWKTRAQRERHHKFKRCLDKAKWCYDRWVRAYHLSKLEKTRFYVRWQKRWLELAEKFNPNSTSPKENNNG